MFDTQKRLVAVAITFIAAIGSASIAVGENQTGAVTESHNGLFSCEIQTSSANGMITLEGVVQANDEVNGSYRFRVKNAGHSGSSNIQQGGNFSADPNDITTLGRVMLGSRNAVYDASLEVTANGVTVSCDKRVGGAI